MLRRMAVSLMENTFWNFEFHLLKTLSSKQKSIKRVRLQIFRLEFQKKFNFTFSITIAAVQLIENAAFRPLPSLSFANSVV